MHYFTVTTGPSRTCAQLQLAVAVPSCTSATQSHNVQLVPWPVPVNKRSPCRPFLGRLAGDVVIEGMTVLSGVPGDTGVWVAAM